VIDRHSSVFAKLVAVMVTMAASLLLLVGGFFWLIISPAVSTSMNRVLDEYARTIAATSPDVDTARRLGARLDLQVRYEGPRGGWSTISDLPQIEEVRKKGVTGWTPLLRGRHYYIVAGPDRGAYLFAWSVPRGMLGAHHALLILLLLVMTLVVLTAHAVLNRLLRPLRDLNDGVARLGAGELDVMLPNQTRDEFGRLTAAFNQMVGRVREMIAARDQLLLDVSHELRSPLTRMKVALEMLPRSEQRTGMATDVAEMERMIAQLLELERLRGSRGVSPVRHDLMPILREVAHNFENRPPGVRVVSTLREVPLDIDADKIRMVFRNLLENATKYSLPQSAPVELSAVQDGDTVVVRVTDHGPGIPEADHERVFEPFFRVDRSRTKRTGGYGLGLSICKRVMEAHGGSISVESADHQGASFVLTFPKAARSRGAEQEPRTPESV
jgi:signal transduction histidine kinase